MKPSIYIDPHNNLEKIDNAIASPRKADYGIAWKRDIAGLPRDKVVMCQTEPPISRHVVETYEHADEYRRFIGFGDFGEMFDSPYMPYTPAAGLRRKPRIGEGIYFAGKKGSDFVRFGYQVIYGLRARLAEVLIRRYGGNAYGKGFSKSTKRYVKDTAADQHKNPVGWHVQKFIDIDDLNPAYILSAENTIMDGYMTEKFWDGLLSGCCMIYVGDPLAVEKVPQDIYIDITDLVGNGKVAINAILKRIEEFDPLATAERASEWLDTAIPLAMQKRKDLTNDIVEGLQ